MSSREQSPTPPSINTRTVWVLAIACALTVANRYYIQPLLADISRSFAISEGAAGVFAMLMQIGYALGLLLIVPLGSDWLELSEPPLPLWSGNWRTKSRRV